MTIDPYRQLRPVDPVPPDPRFVARLRRRIEAALNVDDNDNNEIPVIELPERSTTMTDTTTNTVTITPYLCVHPAVDALAWYAANFEAVETIRYTGDDGRIGHAEVTIGGAVVMLSDEYPELDVVAPTTLGGTATTLHLQVPDADATYTKVVGAGARVAGEPKDEAYGARGFSMLDPFGHRWMIQTPIASPTSDEIEADMGGYTITTPAAGSVALAAAVEVGYVTFALPDTEAAMRFYGNLFGWSAEVGNAGDEYRHVTNTELPLGVTPGAVDEPPKLYFRVDDLGASTARVRELGGTVVSEDAYESGPNAVCRDDQGREFQLWQPAPGY